jgi:hypothetical protein
MSTRNIALAVIALIALLWVLAHGLHHAWMGLRVPAFGFIILAFVAIGWLWGRFSK